MEWRSISDCHRYGVLRAKCDV